MFCFVLFWFPARPGGFFSFILGVQVSQDGVNDQSQGENDELEAGSQEGREDGEMVGPAEDVPVNLLPTIIIPEISLLRTKQTKNQKKTENQNYNGSLL